MESAIESAIESVIQSVVESGNDFKSDRKSDTKSEIQSKQTGLNFTVPWPWVGPNSDRVPLWFWVSRELFSLGETCARLQSQKRYDFAEKIHHIHRPFLLRSTPSEAKPFYVALGSQRILVTWPSEIVLYGARRWARGLPNLVLIMWPSETILHGAIAPAKLHGQRVQFI